MALEDLTDEEIEYLLRQQGMGMASGNPFSTAGAYAPELTDFAYDLPSMLGGIPISTSSKGVPNPQNVEQAAKRLNYGQDLIGSGGLGSDMLAMIAGGQATDPSAWRPVRKGVGSPMAFENRAMAEQLAESGGGDFQSFMAAEMLKGATPAAAFTKLKQIVKGVNGVSQASPELLDSLNAYVNADFDPTGAGRQLDITNDRDFATLYDTKAIQGWASDLYKGLAKDRALESSGYRDEKTGQVYSGFVDEDTPQMKAARELGLAFPTQSYADEDVIDTMSQGMFGLQPGEGAWRNQQHVDRAMEAQNEWLGANQASKKNEGDFSMLEKAYNDAVRKSTPYSPGASAPVGRPVGDTPFGRTSSAAALAPTQRPTPTTMGPYVGMAPSHESGAIVSSPTPRPTGARLTGSWMGQPRDTRAISGLPLPYNLLAEDITGSAPTPVSQTTVYNDKGQRESGKPKGAVKPQAGGLAAPWSNEQTRKMLAQERGAADVKRKDSKKAEQAAYERYGRTLALSPDDLERAKMRVTLGLLAKQGRTPMQDQLAARSQTLRNLVGY